MRSSNNSEEGSSISNFDKAVLYGERQFSLKTDLTKASVFGSDPDLRERVKSELAQVSVSDYGDNTQDKMDLCNEHLKTARIRIQTIKKDIRDRAKTPAEIETLFQQIKPSIKDVLVANEGVVNHLRQLALTSSKQKSIAVDGALQGLAQASQQLRTNWQDILDQRSLQ